MIELKNVNFQAYSLLNSLANKFDENNIGLYRNEGLARFKNADGHQAVTKRKEFHQLFN